MEQFKYNNHTVTVHTGYNGKSIHIQNAEGIQIYAHKFHGDALEHAKLILGEEPKAAAVAAPVAQAVVIPIKPRFTYQPLTPAQMFQARVNRILQQVAA